MYYTPEPVVGYIVRSLHRILKTHFDKSDGLASDGVTLLDPAAGTRTFVARATQQAVAIAFFIKRGRTRPKAATATVDHADLYGSREAKYAWLDRHDFQRTRWRKLSPTAPSTPKPKRTPLASAQIRTVSHEGAERAPSLL